MGIWLVISRMLQFPAKGEDGPNSITLGVEANNVLNIFPDQVGIGTTNPNSKVEIRSNSSASSNSALSVTDNLGASLLFVRDDGNVGVGVGNPSEKLVVDGNIFPGQDNVYKLGDGSNRWDEIWTSGGQLTVSDKRLKTDIDSLQYGINEIMELSPISYYREDAKQKGRYLGLIAQDLEKIINEPVKTSNTKEKFKGVRYPALIPVLINGMQEQQKQIQKQQQEIRELQASLEQEKAKKEALEEKVNQLKQQMNELAEQVNGVSESFNKADEESLNQKTATLSNEDEDQAMLLQNRPNPYANETVIPYYLPRDFASATLMITNTNGQLIKRISLEKAGKGELTLEVENLNTGQYIYSLIVDGKEIRTRKMVIKK